MPRWSSFMWFIALQLEISVKGGCEQSHDLRPKVLRKKKIQQLKCELSQDGTFCPTLFNVLTLILIALMVLRVGRKYSEILNSSTKSDLFLSIWFINCFHFN